MGKNNSVINFFSFVFTLDLTMKYALFRLAEHIRVIIESVETHPVCEHGPALLFERLFNAKCQQFYACSAYRDQKECPLHISVDHIKPITYNRDQLERNAEKSLKFAQDKSSLLQQVMIIFVQIIFIISFNQIGIIFLRY